VNAVGTQQQGVAGRHRLKAAVNGKFALVAISHQARIERIIKAGIFHARLGFALRNQSVDERMVMRQLLPHPGRRDVIDPAVTRVEHFAVIGVAAHRRQRGGRPECVAACQALAQLFMQTPYHASVKWVVRGFTGQRLQHAQTGQLGARAATHPIRHRHRNAFAVRHILLWQQVALLEHRFAIPQAVLLLRETLVFSAVLGAGDGVRHLALSVDESESSGSEYRQP